MLKVLQHASWQVDVAAVLFVALDEPGDSIGGEPQFLALVEEWIVEGGQVLYVGQEP